MKHDQLVHAYGFGATMLVCWEALRSILVGTTTPTAPIRPSVGMLTLCAAVALGIGALNEIVEFAATFLVPKTNVGGYLNTGWDLVSNLVGAVSAAVLIFAVSRRS